MVKHRYNLENGDKCYMRSEELYVIKGLGKDKTFTHQWESWLEDKAKISSRERIFIRWFSVLIFYYVFYDLYVKESPMPGERESVSPLLEIHSWVDSLLSQRQRSLYISSLMSLPGFTLLR